MFFILPLSHRSCRTRKVRTSHLFQRRETSGHGVDKASALPWPIPFPSQTPFPPGPVIPGPSLGWPSTTESTAEEQSGKSGTSWPFLSSSYLCGNFSGARGKQAESEDYQTRQKRPLGDNVCGALV